MVLEAINELATGFEGCEKRLEINFKMSPSNTKGCRAIPREWIDRILTLARCTVISHTFNNYFDAYVLSESSLFVYPNKVVIKTCGTTLLLRCMNELLTAAKSVGCESDFLLFSRSNFIFPHKQSYPHRAFGEESGYLNKELAKQGSAYILGPIHGPRWHLYTLDFKIMEPNEYHQQTLEIIMFNLDPTVMKTFYKRNEGEEVKLQCGFPQGTGKEATFVAGIDKFLPGSVIDDNLFTPCGYSCNGLLNEAYFTIHITPEPECSFVSFETNLVSKNYTDLVKQVISTFKPGTWSVSLWCDECSECPDSRAGLAWAYEGFECKGVMHHSFPDKHNVTCCQFDVIKNENDNTKPTHPIYGSASQHANITSPSFTSYTTKLNAQNGTNLLDHESINDPPVLELSAFSYETVSSLTLDQMLSLAVDTAKGRFVIEGALNSNSNSNNNNDDPSAQDGRIKTLAERVISSHLPEKAFYLVDIGQVVRRFYEWTRSCPRLIPVYQIGSDSESGMVAVLAALGCHYSAHSTVAAKHLLKLGVNASRILLTQPYKTMSTVRFAADKNISHLTVHTTHEIDLISVHAPKAKVVLTLASNGAETQFGNNVPDTITLAKYAQSKNVTVEGLRIYLPQTSPLTQAMTNEQEIDITISSELSQPLSDATLAYESLKEIGIEIRVVDLGSVFPSHFAWSLNKSAEHILAAVDRSLPSSLALWANPAFHLEDNTQGLVVNVLAKSKKEKDSMALESTDKANNNKDLKRSNASVTNSNNQESAGSEVQVDYVVGEGGGVTVFSQQSKKRKILPVSTTAYTHHNSNNNPSNNSSGPLLPASIRGVLGDAVGEVVSIPLNEKVMLPEVDVGSWLFVGNVRPPSGAGNTQPHFADVDTHPLYYVSS